MAIQESRVRTQESGARSKRAMSVPYTYLAHGHLWYLSKIHHVNPRSYIVLCTHYSPGESQRDILNAPLTEPSQDFYNGPARQLLLMLSCPYYRIIGIIIIIIITIVKQESTGPINGTKEPIVFKVFFLFHSCINKFRQCWRPDFN